MSTLICHGCRRRTCSKRWQVARQTVLSMVDGRAVKCDDFLPNWQTQLAA